MWDHTVLPSSYSVDVRPHTEDKHTVVEYTIIPETGEIYLPPGTGVIPVLPQPN